MPGSEPRVGIEWSIGRVSRSSYHVWAPYAGPDNDRFAVDAARIALIRFATGVIRQISKDVDLDDLGAGQAAAREMIAMLKVEFNL